VHKRVVWLATARKDVPALADDARARTGYELYRVQQGLDPTDWKPRNRVGDGVWEIRIRTTRQHRVLYVAKFADAVYVLHAFAKKTRRTSRLDLELGRKRYRELMSRRRRSR